MPCNQSNYKDEAQPRKRRHSVAYPVMPHPEPRVVLLKDISEQGFTFYTNLESIKAKHLDANPRAGLCFYWMPLHKQIRIVGKVEKVSEDDADAYFASRPRESQLGAWASHQSETLDDRVTLVENFQKYLEKYEGGPVPRPDFWSGYRLKPAVIEFWLAHPYRLHERLVYRRNDDESWAPSELLYP